MRVQTPDPTGAEDRDFAVGEELDWSYRWDDGNPTDECLGGTCCLTCTEDTVDQVTERATAIYPGARAYLITGEFWGYGEDTDEIILRDAVVLARL